MGDALTSTRVNSALLPRYTGKNRQTNSEARQGHATCRSTQFYEVIGSVANPTTIKMYYCVDMGTDIDMKLVDDTVKLMHDPRFFTKIFSPTD
ncbi:hypothetical protein C8J57DRAFT_1727028 [Mycena rebaudengoi]|nr:hypothetical protein C8J57DRAFT_1727028 [Mycena rebaudengoi]